MLFYNAKKYISIFYIVKNCQLKKRRNNKKNKFIIRNK